MVGLRDLTARPWADRAVAAMNRANRRHPWSHNDHFHSWILANLPDRRGTAVDVGCGEGLLAEQLAPHVDRVIAVDRDAVMLGRAAARCALVPNVSVSDTALDDLPAGLDLITMVAVLHHLDLEAALTTVRQLLAPGGRFLVVGLTRPATGTDALWDAASMLTNPLIGLVKHPWPAPELPESQVDRAMPIADPGETFDQLRDAAERLLPGAVLRRRLGFRYTLEWTAVQQP